MIKVLIAMFSVGFFLKLIVGKNHPVERDDGPREAEPPASVECSVDADGSKHWHKNGQHHRDDGPAVEYADGTKYWYKNGQFHRDDGPAIECADGTKYWYKYGLIMSGHEG